MLAGARLLLEGIALLRRERRLWPLAAAPVAIAVAAVLLAATLVWLYAAPLYALLTSWLPVMSAGDWYTWIWIGPMQLIVWLAGALLFALAAALSVALAFLLASVVAAPFLDLLSRRVEEIVAGRVVESEESGLRALWTEGRLAIVGELQRLLWFGGAMLLISLIGIVVPGGQIVAPPLFVALTALFLPLQYAGYALDRRRVPFRERRRWLLSRWPMMAAFGGTAFLTFLVPGLNFFMVPALVVAGTLLAIRYPP